MSSKSKSEPKPKIKLKHKIKSTKSKPNFKITKGIGAGGKNTNLFGKTFEQSTNIENNLYNLGFTKITMNKTKFGYYLYKQNKIIYLTQNSMKIYFKIKFNIQLFRNPDEVFIIETKNKYYVKILEKKRTTC